MRQKAELIGLGVKNGITNLETIKKAYNEYAEGGPLKPYSAGSLVDAIYKSSKGEEYLGEPSHHYDVTIPEEEANRLGYYPNSRGHRDDRVKKPAHPTHPSRGNWHSFEEFELTDKGMESPNYTLFGLNDGGQDPQAVMTYKEGIVLPEITVTPKRNYIYNSYDNINIYATGGPFRPRPKAVPKGHSSEIYDNPEWYEEHREDVEAHNKEVEERHRKYEERRQREVDKAEAQFNSMRGANDELAKTIKTPIFTKEQINEAQANQYEKNLNTWRPTLQTADLGLNLATMYSGNPTLFGLSMFTNGVQLGDAIANDESISGETTSLLFDTAGLLGSFNRLPTLKFQRTGPNGRRTTYTIDTDKVADRAGFIWNGVDSASDLYGIGNFGVNWASTPNANLVFQPFNK